MESTIKNFEYYFMMLLCLLQFGFYFSAVVR